MIFARIIFCATLAMLSASAADAPPNIVFVIADQWRAQAFGFAGDVNVKTPNLDRLARDGLRLTACYSAGANCSPSRTGLMTGRTPYRVGVHNQIPFLSPMHLRVPTLGDLLKQHKVDLDTARKVIVNGMLGDQPLGLQGKQAAV